MDSPDRCGTGPDGLIRPWERRQSPRVPECVYSRAQLVDVYRLHGGCAGDNRIVREGGRRWRRRGAASSYGQREAQLRLFVATVELDSLDCVRSRLQLRFDTGVHATVKDKGGVGCQCPARDLCTFHQVQERAPMPLPRRLRRQIRSRHQVYLHVGCRRQTEGVVARLRAIASVWRKTRKLLILQGVLRISSGEDRPGVVFLRGISPGSTHFGTIFATLTP